MAYLDYMKKNHPLDFNESDVNEKRTFSTYNDNHSTKRKKNFTKHMFIMTPEVENRRQIRSLPSSSHL